MTTYTITPFLNETSRFDPYSPGDTLKRSVMAFTDVRADGIPAALSTMFRLMNADDRPNGKVERSLSVGDVLMVEWLDYDTLSVKQERYACDPVGWRKI